MSTLILPVLSVVSFLLLSLYMLWRLPPLWALRVFHAASASRIRTAQSELPLTRKDLLDCENNIRSCLAQILAACAVLGTLIAAWLSLQATNKNIEETRTHQHAERYANSLKLLASSTRTERLGGVYALESLALATDTAADYAWAALETLSALARDRSPKRSSKTGNSGPCDEFRYPIGRRADLQPTFPDHETHASIRSIAKILRLNFAAADDWPLKGVDLSRSSFCKVYAPDGFFRHVYFAESLLMGAIFDGADLSWSVLSEADLREAHLSAARLDNATLHNATLRDAQIERASFYDTDLCRADLRDVDFHDARLSGARLTCADLRGADLSDSPDISAEQLLHACINEHTILKDGLNVGETPNCISKCMQVKC